MAEINQQLSRLLSAWCELRLMYREASVSRSYRRSAVARARADAWFWWRAVLSAPRGSVVVVGGGGKAARDAGKLRHETPPPPPPTRAGARPTTRTDHGTHGTCVDRPARARRRPRPHRTGRVSYSRRDVIAVRRSTISLSSDTISRSWLATLCLAADQLQPLLYGSRRRQLAPQLRPSR